LKYALFLGCTAPVRAQNYELATRHLLKFLGVGAVDLSFTCCGYPVEAASEEAATLMSARNLALAEKNSIDILTFCNACYGNLCKANYLLKNDDSTLNSINSRLATLGLQFSGTVRIRHLLEILTDEIGLGNLKTKIKYALKGRRLAAYYGCHYLKPSVYMNHHDHPDNPSSLDRLIELTGAESVSSEGSKKCCGGALLGIKQDLALAMSNEVLGDIEKSGIDAIVAICPFCGIMLDTCQSEIEERFDKRYGIPVLYLPQLIGLSIGLDSGKLGLQLNRVSLDAFLEGIG